MTSTAPTSAAVDANALRAQAESDALRVRSEADAIKRQAESELARARSDADAAKAARMNVEASAAAARTRALADADAARIRAEAESSAARTRSEADAAARAIQLQAAVPAQVRPAADAAARTSAATAQETRVPDKGPRALAGDAGQFDGVWNVAVECPKADDGALGYRYEFMAQVKDGLLRGDQGTEGTAGWLRLQGKIEADGTARFDAKGLTGDPKYNLKSVRKGAPYEFQVAARFVGSRGTGLRLQLRPCVLTFVRQ